MNIAFVENMLRCKVQAVKTEVKDDKLNLWVKVEGADNYVQLHIMTVSGTV